MHLDRPGSSSPTAKRQGFFRSDRQGGLRSLPTSLTRLTFLKNHMWRQQQTLWASEPDPRARDG